MKQRRFSLHDAAQNDVLEIWELIARRDGSDRADAVHARIEAFCRSLREFAEIGTRYDERRPGLRSTGIPGLRSVTVMFQVDADTVTVLRIGYLGRNVFENLPA